MNGIKELGFELGSELSLDVSWELCLNACSPQDSSVWLLWILTVGDLINPAGALWSKGKGAGHVVEARTGLLGYFLGTWAIKVWHELSFRRICGISIFSPSDGSSA